MARNMRRIHAVISGQAIHTMCGSVLAFKDQKGMGLAISSKYINSGDDRALKRKGCTVYDKEPTCVYCRVIKKTISLRRLESINKTRVNKIEKAGKWEELEGIEEFDIIGSLQFLDDYTLAMAVEEARATTKRLYPLAMNAERIVGDE